LIVAFVMLSGFAVTGARAIDAVAEIKRNIVLVETAP